MTDTMSRGGTHCACRFDDDDEVIHTCNWHRDEFAKLHKRIAVLEDMIRKLSSPREQADRSDAADL